MYWEQDDIMTVKLHCDQGYVDYFQNNEWRKRDNIDEDESYFFALNSCESTDNWFEVVETPSIAFIDRK